MMLRYEGQELIDLLDEGAAYGVYVSDEQLKKNADELNKVLKEMDIGAKVIKFAGGPAFSEYRLSVKDIVSIEKIGASEEEIRERMGVRSFRIVKERRFGLRMREVTVEMANNELTEVKLKDFFTDFRFRLSSMMIPLGAGTHRRYSADLDDNIFMGGDNDAEVHGFIDAVILSLLCTQTPRDLNLILIGSSLKDFEELSDLPHVNGPVIKDVSGLRGTLRDIDRMINDRYELFYGKNTRSFVEYNREARFTRRSERIPRIVCVISDIGEYDLNEEDRRILSRIIIRGKNAGVNFLIANTDLLVSDISQDIKDVIDARVAFWVSGEEESRTILDLDLATGLLGEGDLIYSTPFDTEKVQSPRVSAEEYRRVTEYIRENQSELYAERRPLRHSRELPDSDE
ncbi:MAG: hypothetical protein J6U23_14405 [Clostridiales bacterium]|nr:hypothetical protein [Clostridiales bacterium]